MTVERMLEYLCLDRILFGKGRVEVAYGDVDKELEEGKLSTDELSTLSERYYLLRDEFVNEYKLPGSNKNFVKN